MYEYIYTWSITITKAEALMLSLAVVFILTLTGKGWSNGIYMATHNYIYNLLPSYLKTVTFHTLLILLNKLHAALTIGTIK